MPYRQRLGACAACGVLGTAAECPRCRGALCVVHLPLGGQRCEACEAAYRVEASALRLGVWRLAGQLVAVPLFALLVEPLGRTWQGKIAVYGGLSGGLAVLDSALILVGGGAVLGWLFAALRRTLGRRRFLAETTGRG